jgi:hypothetical protein
MLCGGLMARMQTVQQRRTMNRHIKVPLLELANEASRTGGHRHMERRIHGL